MPPPASRRSLGATMTTTTEPDTTAPAQPELRVTIVLPLSPEPFAQARQLADIEPAIDSLRDTLPGTAVIERRVVRPKPAKRPAALASLLALLLIPACGVATTEADCLRSTQEHCLPMPAADDGAAGHDGEGGAA